MTEPRFDERLCSVCRRPARGYGYAMKARTVADIAWVCDDPDCIAIARDTYGMKQLEFGRIDSMATSDAGEALEAYLDSIGKTDLRQLTQKEWDEALRATIGGYRAALKGRLQNEAPF